MTRTWGALVVGWALMFGKPGTDVAGWKKLATFDSKAACEQERNDRAGEVRDKTTTQQSLEAVLAFYRCTDRGRAHSTGKSKSGA